MSPPICPVCKMPAHAGETNDRDEHPACAKQAERLGIEELRLALLLFDDTSETFNQRFSAAELLLIFRAHRRGEWDYYPDQWTAEELAKALRGEGVGAEFER